MNNPNDKTEEIKLKLIPWLKEKMPHAENLSLPEFHQPGMGMSSETYLLTVEWEEAGSSQSQGMVLRSAPQDFKVFPDYELTHQFKIMKALEQTDVPCAKMLWMEENASLIGSPFFLMGRLFGDVPQDYPSYHGSGMFFDATPEQRAKMWWASLEAMTKIHRLEWQKLNLSFLGVPKGGIDPVDRQIAYWDRYFEWMKDAPDESHPTIEASMKWLKENRYEPERIALCWGDARMGNTLYDKDFNVIAVMDWEMAFLSDPEADLAWFMLLDWQHSGGAGLPRCEGTPEYDDTVKKYEELTGWKVKHLLFNEVFSAVRYGMILVAVLKKFIKQNIPIEEDMLLNNVCTQRLSELLDLPSPGPKRHETADIKDITVSVQFHFTGPNGYDWYIISEKGTGTCYDGVIDNPTCTITATLEDWNAIQSGELDRIEAWSSGRLVTDGDINVMVQLEEVIAEFTKPI